MTVNELNYILSENLYDKKLSRDAVIYIVGIERDITSTPYKVEIDNNGDLYIYI